MQNSVNTRTTESCRDAKYYSLHIEVNIIQTKDGERTKNHELKQLSEFKLLVAQLMSSTEYNLQYLNQYEY
jgi:hypothetical protein